MTRMQTAILLLLLSVTPAERLAAEADRARYAQADQGYLYYASTSHLEGESRAACEASLAFTTASSSSQPIIEKCVPQAVNETLWRIDIRELRWSYEAFHTLFKDYPYSRAPYETPHLIPLVFHADWLVVQLADSTEGGDIYGLLYGDSKINRDGYLKFWGVNQESEHAFGVIVDSQDPLGPAVAGIRQIEQADTDQRTSAWKTRDSAKITKDSDPLEHLTGDFKSDAEEHIVGMPKVSITTGKQGMLLAFFLSNAKGDRQEAAPPNIVTDKLEFRGRADIRNGAGGSCLGCHSQGIIPPGVSEFRRYIVGKKAGVDIYASPKKVQEQIDLFHGSDLGKQVQRDNEDFLLAVKLVNGLDGTGNYEAFRSTIDEYDRDVTLHRAALELGTEPRELSLALGYYSQHGGKVSARLAGLADDLPMPRSRWEEIDGWYTGYVALQMWGKK